MPNSDGRKRGVGVASCWYGCGNTSLPNPSTIKLGLSPDGSVVLHQGAVDIGQGSNTVIAQIAADALGLPLGAFRLRGADTAITPDAGKTSASRQTFVSGKAAEKAARALARTRSCASPMSRTGRRCVSTAQRSSIREGEADAPHRTLRSLPADATAWFSSARGNLRPADRAARRQGPGQALRRLWLWRADRRAGGRLKLGTVKLIKITAAHDVGKAINPMLAEGQIEGGIAQGIGMALMEEYVPGRTENLHDYLIPTIGDVPPIETILIEVPDPGRTLRRQGAWASMC